MAGTDLRPAATQTTFLRNVMMRVPEYRQSLTAIKAPPGDEAEPFTHFLKLESPVFRPAPADTALSFNPQALPDLRERECRQKSLELDWRDSARQRGRTRNRSRQCARGPAVQRRDNPLPRRSLRPAVARGHHPRRFQL